MERRTEQEHADDVAELAEGAQIIIRAAAAELHDAHLWPSPAQWARRNALTDALDWVEFVAAGTIDEPGGPSSVDTQLLVEAIAERWAAWIESGEMPA